MTAAGFAAELTYPLREPALLVSTIVFTLLLALAGAAGILGIWLGLLVLVAFIKFLVDALRARALGLRLAVPGIDAFNPADQPWKLAVALAAVVLLALAQLAGRNLGAIVGGAVGLAGLTLFPALAAAIAIEQRPLAALQPGLLRGLLQRLGRDYLWIPCGLLLGSVAAEVIAALAGPSLLVSAVNNLTLVLAFTLTGAVLYEHRDDIGLAVQRAPEIAAERERRRGERDRRSFLDRAYASFSRGNTAAGVAELKSLLSAENDSAAAYDWLYTALDEWSDKRPLQLFAPRYLERLLRDGRDGEALTVAAESLRRGPPPALSEALKSALAAVAARSGNVRLAGRLRALAGPADS